MKRIKVIAGVIVLVNLVFTLNTQAQYQVEGSEEFINKMKMKSGGNALNKISYEDIKGTPYLFPDFKSAIIITQNDENIKLPVRYDLYANEMEVKNESRIYSIAHPEIIKLITTDSIKLIYSRFTNSSDRDQTGNYSYFILRSDGRCRFLIKKELRLQDPEKPKLYQDAKPPEFIFLRDTYYFKIGENDAIRINTRSDAMVVMADKATLIGEFIKENRINMNKAQDLQKLAEYYSNLFQ